MKYQEDPACCRQTSDLHFRRNEQLRNRQAYIHYDHFNNKIYEGSHVKHVGGSAMVSAAFQPVPLDILSKLMELCTQKNTIRFESTMQYHLESI